MALGGRFYWRSRAALGAMDLTISISSSHPFLDVYPSLVPEDLSVGRPQQEPEFSLLVLENLELGVDEVHVVVYLGHL
jgi:hypothetical protein